MTKYGIEEMIGEKYPNNMPAYEDKLTDDEIIAALSYIKSTWSARIQQQRGLLLADQAWQRHAHPKAGMEAEPVEAGAKARFAACDAEVRHQRQSQPRADRGTRNGRHDGLAVAVQLHGLSVEGRWVARDAALVGAAEIGPGAEGAHA